MTGSGFLSVEGLTVGYGRTVVLDSIDLAIQKGEFVALLGSSGCGKTTLLRSIAGFISPVSGRVLAGGTDITRLGPERRNMAMVFQSYALWPHMTVRDNIGYGLKLRRVSKVAKAARIAEMESLLGLEGLLSRKPGALSGGQRQRVALGRALAIDPEILLLDEPLSNLDARIRLSLRTEIRALQQRLGITAIHVTHDREEAMVMADRIVILNKGHIEQQGAPEDVYNRPQSSFVAAFMGAENVVHLDATVSEQRLHIAAGGEVTSLNPEQRRTYGLLSGPVVVRFRAEAATLASVKVQEAARDDVLQLHGRVIGVSYPGGCWRHVIQLADGAEVLVDETRAFEPGSNVMVRIPDESLFIFNTAPEHGAGPSLSRSPAEVCGVREQQSSVEPQKTLETNR